MEKEIKNFLTTKGLDLVIEYGQTIILSLLLLLIGLWVIKILRKTILNSFKRVIPDEGLAGFLSNLINTVLKVMLFIAVASLLGIETASFLAVLGSVGLAVGLALQGSLTNMAGGIVILFFKPFKKGDFVTIDGEDGFIHEIDILHTVILTRLNRIVVIPNSIVTAHKVINHSKEEFVRRRFYLNISYDSDIQMAKKAIYDGIAEVEHIRTDPKPFTEVSDIQDSSIQFRIFIWCKPEDYFRVKEPAIENIKYKFDEYGVKLPFLRRVIELEKPLD